MTYKAGDPVFVIETDYRGDESPGRPRLLGEVLKVGRVYATVACQGFEHQFRLDNGLEKPLFTARLRIRTADQLADGERRKAARDRLRDAGVEFRGGVVGRLTTGTLTAIADLVEREKDGPLQE